PMIAKVVTYGRDRIEAIDRMRDALNGFVVRGVAHNIPFLSALIEHPRFRSGRLTTNFIAEEYPDGFQPHSAVHDQPWLVIAVAAAIHRRYMQRAAQITGQLPGYERTAATDWVIVWDGALHNVVADDAEDRSGVCVVGYQGQDYRVQSDWQFGHPLFRGTINEQPICMQVERRNMTYRLYHWGSQIDLTVVTKRAAELLACMPPKPEPDLSKYLLSPMPGLLKALCVGAGEPVKRGQDLAVVEAMKMENVLRAERDGVVDELLAEVGATVDVDQRLIAFQ
ncbi:MAG: hypothetical protein KDA61_10325, partial [Planctomycetales bacterium]|nr:hypothetical protein [Planctomycetales bacterium]